TTGRLVLHIVGLNREAGQFVLLIGMAGVVSPQPRLPLKSQRAGSQEIAHVRFFAVDVSGQPQVGTHVFAPAIEMKIEISPSGRRAASVEADDIEITVFNP